MRIAQVDIAMWDYIRTYGVTDEIPECPVTPGNLNRVSRSNKGDYVIYTRIMQPAITRKSNFWLVDYANAAAAGKWIVGNIQVFTYQVDVWGEHSSARMARLKNIFEDAIGCEFFEKNYHDMYGGIGVVGASAIRNTTAVAGTSDYEHCYSADFKLTAAIEDTWNYEGIDAIDFDLIGVDTL